MNSLRIRNRTSLLLAGLALASLACAGCAQLDGGTGAATITRSDLAGADLPVPSGEFYPADVFRPVGYLMRNVTRSERVLTIHGEAPGSVAALFDLTRATMPMQGWDETRAEQSETVRTLVFGKSGFEAEFTFQPAGNETRLRLQMRHQASDARVGML
jgi:hypothetical protein